jgi:hypothetical protein
VEEYGARNGAQYGARNTDALPQASGRTQRRERGAGVLGSGVLGSGVLGSGVLRGNGCRMFRMQRDKGQFSRGDLLMVVPDAVPEGGEYVIDLEGRVGRHGGGPVLGVVVGIVRNRR